MNIGLEERVRTRAYKIWEREGSLDGGAEQHWLGAEEELRAEEAGLGKDIRTHEILCWSRKS